MCIALAGEILAKGYFPVIIPVGFIGNSLSFLVSTLMNQPKFYRTCRWNEVRVQSLFWPIPEQENATDLRLLSMGIDWNRERIGDHPPTQRKLHVNENVWHIYIKVSRSEEFHIGDSFQNTKMKIKNQRPNLTQWPSKVSPT